MILTNENFRKEMIRYLDANWHSIISVQEVADAYGYTPKYFERKFKKHFGITFNRYLKKIKLHRAALAICEQKKLTNVAKIAGFSNAQSFFKAFYQEFGMGPKEFLFSKNEIPDLPTNYFVQGNPVTVEYIEAETVTAYGHLICPVHGAETNLLDECGYYFDHVDERLNVNFEEQDWIGVWWYGELYELRYFIGEVFPCNSAMDKGLTSTQIPADYYAVFSVPIAVKNANENVQISEAIKQLAHFAFEEWAVINCKQTKKMGCTYERYSKNRVALYVPVHKRFFEGEDMSGMGPTSWIQYIDEHITETLTAELLAERFFYSEDHFRDIFTMYYGISPAIYIKKRRLYLIACELGQEYKEIHQIVEDYGYHTLEDFERDFYHEFQIMPKDYRGGEYKVEDLVQYYDFCKDKLVISFRHVERFQILGKNVIVGENTGYLFPDLIECIAYRLQNEPKNQYIAWTEMPESGDLICICGTKETIEEETENALIGVSIQGGTYAVLASQNASDEDDLMENYRMLYRCAFSGWVKENFARVDMDRLTFVQYENGKLYFFIPVKG